MTLPKGVWFATKRLASGEVVKYGYLGRGAEAKALGRAGTPGFHTNLAEALSKVPSEDRVSFIVWRYQNDAEFKKLAALTQRDYRRQLDKIKTKFGRLSIAAMDSPKVSDHIYRWRDDMAATSPRQADYAISVLGAMLAWGVRRGLIDHNRAAGVPDAYKSDRAGKVWSVDQQAAILAKANATVQRAVILAVETGLAQQDLLALTWAQVRDRIIVTRRLKNDTPVAIPISRDLAEALKGFPRTSDNVLTKADGKPWGKKGNGLRSEHRAARLEAGVTDRTFHDWRGTYITRRRSMGWTAEETALTSGHPVAGEKGAQGAYADRQTVAIANAERLWSRFYGPDLQTAVQTDEA